MPIRAITDGHPWLPLGRIPFHLTGLFHLFGLPPMYPDLFYSPVKGLGGNLPFGWNP